ncbi:MAG: hypothetical protein JRD68_04910 [Deltaproteobacteria bacterium]|nr:hypothetical protein [Deltaproteobacteria bacterium]
MARIKIDDLPADQKISREEMKKATGGLLIKQTYAYYLDRDNETVLFGDGLDGARLPTGTNNVAATYSSGSGSAGNVT